MPAVIGLRDRPAPGEERLRGGVASFLRLTVGPMLFYAAIAAAGAALL